MCDPTMNYVHDVRQTVEDVVKHMICKTDVEWLDDYTCRITLPKNWVWEI